MIRFACHHCGTKYQVKDQFCGRHAPCRLCRRPLTVPAPIAATLSIPAHIDGPPSHLRDYRGGVTLGECGTTQSVAPRRSVQEALLKHETSHQRYQVEGEIGRGGMGLVLRAIDRDLHREVAVKYLLDNHDEGKKARFIEEAQITGQLEHPNIVPVHEVGLDAQQRLYFTMKMVNGRSIAAVVKALREDSKHAEQQYSLGRLLTAFVNVCNALAYAHVRGVVHRDLKPANVMLGDFGEVYVMDWGLAKVLDHGVPVMKPASERAAGSRQESTGAEPAGKHTSQTNTVTTDRMEDSDLTQDGAVLGTPAYMPPEQAEGRLHDIGPRSDVYSLGAILYEVLTLQPPISTKGGVQAMLKRVTEGEIVPPESVAGRRVPRELAAIAMKALATDPENRYPSAAALRQDVELYQEGRSVSAKDDSKWEMMVKFVKRHRGFSGAVGGSLVVIAAIVWFFFQLNYQARLRAEEASQETRDAYQEVRQEQAARRQQGRHSAPAFLRDARASVARNELDYALAQVNVALDYDPELHEALLLKGQMLIAMKRFGEAEKTLVGYVEQKPDDGEARKLAALCRGADLDDLERMREFAHVFLRQKELALAGKMLRANEELLALYLQRIEEAWPDLPSRIKRTARLKVEKATTFALDLGGCGAVVKDLSPLRGMLLDRLTLQACGQIHDLEPLRDMPLTKLDLSKCDKIHDLTPLQGMKLTYLSLASCSKITNLTPLQGMPLTHLDIRQCKEIHDLTPLRDMPLTSLDLAYCGKIRDLSPLQGMPLVSLHLYGADIHDLSPLQGMNLSGLNLSSCRRISELSPLKGMPLTNLFLANCDQITDLTPLAGISIKEIYLPPKVTVGMEVIRAMTSLEQINRKPAEEFWKEYDAKKPDK